MYLLFETYEEAELRNRFEALKRGCNGTTTKYWWAIAYEYEDGRVALDVGDGDGLSDDELNNIVEELIIEE